MPTDLPVPFDAYRDRVRSEWIDHNGHMNMGYYLVVFDFATDEFFRSMVECLNEAPDLDGMGATEDDVRALAEHLVRRAFAEAGEQRLEAAAARLPTAGEQGAWATKLRRMLAAEGRAPGAAE